jgi:hypothetical protein
MSKNRLEVRLKFTPKQLERIYSSTSRRLRTKTLMRFS